MDIAKAVDRNIHALVDQWRAGRWCCHWDLFNHLFGQGFVVEANIVNRSFEPLRVASIVPPKPKLGTVEAAGRGVGLFCNKLHWFVFGAEVQLHGVAIGHKGMVPLARFDFSARVPEAVVILNVEASVTRDVILIVRVVVADDQRVPVLPGFVAVHKRVLTGDVVGAEPEREGKRFDVAVFVRLNVIIYAVEQHGTIWVAKPVCRCLRVTVSLAVRGFLAGIGYAVIDLAIVERVDRDRLEAWRIALCKGR